MGFVFVLGWVCTGLSYASAAICLPLAFILPYTFEYCFPIGLLGCMWLGFAGNWIAHECIDEDDYKSAKAMFFISFIPAIPMRLMFAIIKLGKKIMNAFIKHAESSPPQPKTETVYIVYENGYERELRYIESREDFDFESPYKFEHYNYFKDDMGYYWRSYDNNQSFIKEDYRHINWKK